MYRKTVIISVLLHLGVGALALAVATHDRGRRATSVAVIGDKKEKKAKKQERPARHKPLPRLSRPRPSPRMERPSQEPSSAVTPRGPPAASPALDTEVSLDNANDGGPVIPVPRPGAGPAPAARRDHTPAPRRREPRPGPSRVPSEEICDQPETRPAPIARPVEIEYTAQARSSGVEGRLVLRVTVGADGSVTRVEVVRGVEASLDAAAVAAVRTWTFRPSSRCGKPVAGGTFTLARRFELGD